MSGAASFGRCLACRARVSAGVTASATAQRGRRWLDAVPYGLQLFLGGAAHAGGAALGGTRTQRVLPQRGRRSSGGAPSWYPRAARAAHSGRRPAGRRLMALPCEGLASSGAAPVGWCPAAAPAFFRGRHRGSDRLVGAPLA